MFLRGHSFRGLARKTGIPYTILWRWGHGLRELSISQRAAVDVALGQTAAPAVLPRILSAAGRALRDAKASAESLRDLAARADRLDGAQTLRSDLQLLALDHAELFDRLAQLESRLRGLGAAASRPGERAPEAASH